jgi:hypothetical protein
MQGARESKPHLVSAVSATRACPFVQRTTRAIIEIPDLDDYANDWGYRLANQARELAAAVSGRPCFCAAMAISKPTFLLYDIGLVEVFIRFS